jgi:UDP-N-acetylglucosamine 2-epimerase
MKIAAVIATRPDVIKMAPVIHALRRRRGANVRVVLTSQHRELVTPLLRFFELPIHHDLGVMKPNQTLTHVTTAVLDRFEAVLAKEKPDIVVVQGDTTSAFAGTLAAFYQRIPVGHVEAGLRTYDMRHPFPEEANRKLTTALATWHFAPTPLARTQLLRENVKPRSIHVTGNTVVDALQFALRKQRRHAAEIERKYELGSRKFILVTCHRRENHGAPLERICAAIRDVAARHPELNFIVPLHPNPSAGAKVRAALKGVSTAKLVAPIDYPEFVALLGRCFFVITDSGGIQEEAPAIGKPVLILRERTERPEVVNAGVARLVGSDRAVIRRETLRLIEQPAAYRRMSNTRSLFGDGTAGEQIARILLAS